MFSFPHEHSDDGSACFNSISMINAMDHINWRHEFLNHVTSCLLFMVGSFNNMQTFVHKTKMSFLVLVDWTLFSTRWQEVLWRTWLHFQKKSFSLSSVNVVLSGLKHLQHRAVVAICFLSCKSDLNCVPRQCGVDSERTRCSGLGVRRRCHSEWVFPHTDGGLSRLQLWWCLWTLLQGGFHVIPTQTVCSIVQ